MEKIFEQSTETKKAWVIKRIGGKIEYRVFSIDSRSNSGNGTPFDDEEKAIKHAKYLLSY